MKTLENYKFETNTNPGENLLGFIQGQIRQYIIPDGFYSQLLSITLYSERNISSIVLNSDMTDIHFILTPKDKSQITPQRFEYIEKELDRKTLITDPLEDDQDWTLLNNGCIIICIRSTD